jgi:quercetin dioxygenase-like cupin family protein
MWWAWRGGSIGAMNFEPIKLAVAVAGWATEGQYALVEACVEAGVEIPPHVGHREDVVIHVLGGELEVVVDRERRRVVAGQTVALDRGVPRKLAAMERSRVLALIAPAGLEERLSLAADPTIDADDRAALLAVGRVQSVPAP